MEVPQSLLSSLSKPIRVGVGIGVAVEIGMRKASARLNPMATPIMPFKS
jgi:hypothetical protein